MATGKVKWFSNQKGYGFITSEELGKDVFVHFSAIVSEGYKSLKEGQDVDFEVAQGTKGEQAEKVTVVDLPKVEEAKGDIIENEEVAEAVVEE